MTGMRKIIIMGIAAAMLHSQSAGAAGPAEASAGAGRNVTENEPRIVSTEEAAFGTSQPTVRKGVWVAVGAVVLTGLVVIAAGGGGGGDDGGKRPEETGQVSFNW